MITQKEAFDRIEEQMSCGVAPVRSILRELVAGGFCDDTLKRIGCDLFQIMADKLDDTQFSVSSIMEECERDNTARKAGEEQG